MRTAGSMVFGLILFLATCLAFAGCSSNGTTPVGPGAANPGPVIPGSWTRIKDIAYDRLERRIEVTVSHDPDHESGGGVPAGPQSPHGSSAAGTPGAVLVWAECSDGIEIEGTEQILLAPGSDTAGFTLKFDPYEAVQDGWVKISARLMEPAPGRVYGSGVLVKSPVFLTGLAYNPFTGVLSGGVDAAPGSEIQVSLDLPEGFTIDGPLQLSPELVEEPAHRYYPPTALGHFSYKLIAPSQSGLRQRGSAIVSDSRGNWHMTSAELVLVPPLAPDTLYLIPLKHTTGISAPGRQHGPNSVRIVIATGVPAHPFYYLNGVDVTVEGAVNQYYVPIAECGGTYVADSFDIGIPDDKPDVGSPGDADGFWSAVDPVGGFILPDDSIYLCREIGAGRISTHFSLMPASGTAQTGASGALCNFELNFGRPGGYRLGLHRGDVVSRTYYADAAGSDYDWGTLMADEDGVLAPGMPENINVINVQ